MIHWYYKLFRIRRHFKKIKMQKIKIHDIRTWSTSKIVHEIKQFLKFVNFYKRFIKHFNKIATFLIKILTKSIKFRKHKMSKLKREKKTKVEIINKTHSMIFLFRKFTTLFKNYETFFCKFRYYDISIQFYFCVWRQMSLIKLWTLYLINLISKIIDIS